MCAELERYLIDAVKFQQLAESEGMKRFLEKDQGLSRSPGSSKGFGWPDPTAFNAMGKGMMDVLTKAPKEVAGGGKSFFGGVQNVLGGGKKPLTTSRPQSRHASFEPATMISDSYLGTIGSERQGSDGLRDRPAEAVASRTSVDTESGLARHSSIERDIRPSLSSRSSFQSRQSVEMSRSPSASGLPFARQPPLQGAAEAFNLPPPPSMIDRYEADRSSPTVSHLTTDASRSTTSLDRGVAGTATIPELEEVLPDLPTRSLPEPSKPAAKAKAKPPLNEQETQVTIELLFAVISELYTLSSAWNIRRTLLTAAKTFLLRPGNPQLEAIRVMIQESVIDANSSDAGLAALVLKVRENSLPTEGELEKWPKPLTDKEKEDLRTKARKLLVERGMPQALTSVMGAAASGEALGKVFDCIQIESIAKSMMFGLMLQALRATMQ